MKSKTVVILVNFNGVNDTLACISSIYSGNNTPHIIVIDNTPHDPELNAIATHFPDVLIITSTYNRGFGGGNNLGIKWALSNTDCQFVFLLNNDTLIDPDTITILESELETHTEAGMTTPRIVFKDNPELLWYGGGEISWLRGSAVTPGYLGDSQSTLALKSRYVSFASGCAMLIRREVLEVLHGFDESMFMYEEDLELCLRITNAGWKIAYIPQAIVYHVVQASSRNGQGFVDMFSPLNSNLPFYVYHRIRNRLISMHKHAKGINLMVFQFGFLLFTIKKLYTFATHRRWDGVKAYFNAWRAFYAYKKASSSPHP